jgi:hypothetical protein
MPLFLLIFISHYLAISISPYLYISVSSYIYDMGKMNVVVSDKTEDRFRKAIADYKGFKKGNLSEALEEAIDLWIHAKMRGEK